ncbi:hypothetical protein BFP70_04865 [Thioclava sp. SK-1]|uniref:enoyl-CoA hydratase/isomerase family protein n=1 Tax=Thioclava sp. SK-1 TaxID=1889770 RepID=UPI000824A05C|nr:enoyl-CoA hydratase/isomerase family protein [Thioclava sp. SK-1]OCX66554.1 hypothetical protein BFP70_04865 [Thioclava sp. SK-1]
MSDRVKVNRSEDLAFITMPEHSGGFDAVLRRSLGAAVQLCLEQPLPRAIVLRAGGAWPLTQTPMDDYGDDDAPSLREICEYLSGANVPILAILSGRISGAALALAQAADLRLALDGAVFDIPEYSHGLIPSGGGWVRLVRRLGPARAMDLLTSGRGLDAQGAQVAGLIDAVTSQQALASQAVIEAVKAAEADPALRSLRDQALNDPKTFMEELAQWRKDPVSGPLAPVAEQALTVAEGAMLLPIAAALDLEAVTYADLASAELACALDHLRKSGVQAADAVRDDISAKTIGPRQIALWNGSEQLAFRLLSAGHRLRIGSGDPGQLETLLGGIARRQEIAVHAGRLQAGARDADWDRLDAAADASGTVSGADLVIAAPETENEINALRSARRDGQPLAIETTLAERDEVQLMRYGRHVECRGIGPEADLTAAILLAGGDIVLRMAPGPGLARPMEAAMWAAAERCVMAGATPQAVDSAMEAFGLSEGPLMRADRLGLDIACKAMRATGHPPGALFTYLTMEGQTGRTKGRGIYDWRREDAQPLSDQDPLLQALREEAGMTTPAPTAPQIVIRICAEMANAAAMLLQHGAVDRAGDLDLTAVHALGFPRAKGGPLFQADQTGLLAMRKHLRALAEEGAPAPVTLWDVLIRNGRRFADLADG